MISQCANLRYRFKTMDLEIVDKLVSLNLASLSLASGLLISLILVKQGGWLDFVFLRSR